MLGRIFYEEIWLPYKFSNLLAEAKDISEVRKKDS